MSSPSERLDFAESGKAAREAFSLSPSAHTVYRFKQWQEAWGQLSVQLAARPRLVWLLGDPGTGKSTMLECLANALAGRGASFTRLQGAQVDGQGFLQLAWISLGLDESLTEPEALRERLRAHLRAVSARRDHWLLVDDGDLLSASAFESLLGLGDFAVGPNQDVNAGDQADRVGAGDSETPGGVRIVLSGPRRLPNWFGERLAELEVGVETAQVTLGVLEKSETFAYLQHCLARSHKADQAKFTPRAATAVHHYSRGVPRVANQIGARLIFNALLGGSDTIDLGDVTDVVDGLRAEGLIDVVESPSNQQGSPFGRPVRPFERTEAVRETKATDKERTEPTAFALAAAEDDDTEERVPRIEEGARQSPGLEAPAAPAESRRESSNRSRLGRFLVPAFALVVLVLASAVALRLLNEEAAVNDVARAPHSQADERLGTPAVEKPPPIEDAVDSADSVNVASSSAFEENSLQPSEDGLASERSVGAGASPEQEAPKIEDSVAEREDDSSENPSPVRANPAATLDEDATGEVEDSSEQSGLDLRKVAAALKAVSERSNGANPEPPLESSQQPQPPTEKADVAAVVQSVSQAAAEEGSRENEETGSSLSPHAEVGSERLDDGDASLTVAPSQPPGDHETERAFETAEQVAARAEAPPEPLLTSPTRHLRDDSPEVVALEPLPPSAEGRDTDEGPGADPLPTQGSAVAMLGERSTAANPSDTPERWVKSARVRNLLVAAEDDLENNRFTTPRGDNAYERYQMVLEIDPENAQALEGLEAIVSAYVALVDRARTGQEFERALSYLNRADSVLPGSLEIRTLREQLRAEMAGGTQVAGSGAPPTTATEASPAAVEEFVILPTRTSPDCAWPFDRHLANAVRGFIQSAGLVEVSLSTPVAGTGIGGLPQDDFWLGSSPHEVPNDEQVYLYGERVGARWVLLSRIDCPSSAVVYEPWRGFRIHLFDVESGIAHLQSGTLGELASTTEQVLIANISRDGG